MLNEKFQLTKAPDVHFRELAVQLQIMAARESIQLTAYREESLPHFSSLSPDQQLRVLKSLAHQRDFFELGLKEKLSYDSPQLLWKSLQRMKLTPKSDMLDKVYETDMVEIYWPDGTILFKNINFFKLNTLSLEEVFCLKWYEQLYLSPKMLMFFTEVQAKFHLSLFDNSFQASFIRSYVVKEKLGDKKSFWAKLKWASPVFNRKKKCAMLMIFEVGPA